MSKEYERARQECAKKYNERIRELEQEVQALKTINKAQVEDLKNQSKLQRDFVKLCIFMKLSAEEQDRILNSEVLNELFVSILHKNPRLQSPKYSSILSGIAKDFITRGSYDTLVAELLKSKDFNSLKNLYDKES